MRQTCDSWDNVLELLTQICRSRLAFHIRIRRNDHFTQCSELRTLNKFTHFQLLRPHSIDGGEHSVEHMVQTFVSRFFKRDDFEWFFYNEHECLVPRLIFANITALFGC